MCLFVQTNREYFGSHRIQNLQGIERRVSDATGREHWRLQPVVFLCLICYKLGKPCIHRFGDSESSKYMAQHIVNKHPEAKTTTYEQQPHSGQ